MIPLSASNNFSVKPWDSINRSFVLLLSLSSVRERRKHDEISEFCKIA